MASQFHYLSLVAILTSSPLFPFLSLVNFFSLPEVGGEVHIIIPTGFDEHRHGSSRTRKPSSTTLHRITEYCSFLVPETGLHSVQFP